MYPCPYCHAECRPGDNFCLNCGNRLPSAIASTQGTSRPDQPIDDWLVGLEKIAEAPLWSAAPTSIAKIDKPPRLIVRDDNSNILQEYVLEKPETTIGRAPNSDILLSKDKLTSRRHATIRYENGNYVIHDERSAAGTFVNGQELAEDSTRILRDGDHIGVGEHELIFRAFEQAHQIEQPARVFEQARQVEPLAPAFPRMFVSHSSKDNEFGAKLVQDLRRIVGDENAVWYDTSDGLYGGDAWWRKIVKELTARSVFIVVLSPDAMNSPWVNDEIDLAWRQKNTGVGKRIIPVLYRKCEVREDLYIHQIISFLQPRPYETAFNDLLKALGLSNKRI